MAKNKLPFVEFFIKKNNVKARPYVTLSGESIQGLDGNNIRLVATSHRGDRKFLGKNVINTTQNA